VTDEGGAIAGILCVLSDAADETAAVTNAKLAQKCRESSFMFDP
jgi:hypothetical protein